MTPAQSLQRARVGLGAAGGGLVIGAFLPWADLGGPLGVSVSINGTEGSNDGWITLLCGGVVIAVVALYQVQRRALISLLSGVLAGVVAGYNWMDVRDGIGNAPGGGPVIETSVGNGLWLTLVAAAAVIGFSVWLHRLDRRRA
jgi:hypothetical protein